MSILRFVRSFKSGLKSRLRWPWPLPSWGAIGATTAIVISAASLALSIYTLYLQFWPRYDTTATTLAISVRPVEGRAGDTMQVSVELALWNQGHRPAVISSSYLLFDMCRDLHSARIVSLVNPTTPPFVVSPGDVVLRTLDTDISFSVVGGPLSTAYYFSEPNGKIGNLLALGSQCGAGAQADPKRVYIGVGIEAMQGDGRLETSSRLAGFISQDQTSGLHLNDKYGHVGSDTAHINMWFGHVPNFIEPFSVIPAQRTSSRSD